MSMDLKTKPGAKIVVTSESIRNGTEEDKANASLYLKPKKRFTLRKIQVHDWHTDVWVEEIPGVKFNSVQFENI